MITTKTCLCGGDLYKADMPYCLPCALDVFETNVPRLAYLHRLRGRTTYRATYLATFLDHYPFLNSKLFQLKDTIIKVCEQVQQLSQVYGPQTDDYLLNACINKRKTITTGLKGGESHRVGKLFNRLFTENNHSCTYCKQSYDPDTFHLDTIIPTAFRHTGAGTSVRISYYTAIERIGNLALCCQNCHLFKSRLEQRGNAILQWLYNGRFHYRPPFDRLAVQYDFAHEQYRLFPDASLSPNPRYNLTPHELARNDEYLSATCLRVIGVCNCRSNIIVARYRDPLRSLEFGCPACLPPESHPHVLLERKMPNFHRKIAPRQKVVDTKLLCV